MTKIALDSVKDSGKVRMGAGIRRAAAAAPAAPKPDSKPAPASVADSGKVRLGAGIRRRPA